MKRGRKTQTRKKNKSNSFGVIIIAVIELIVFMSGYFVGSYTKKEEPVTNTQDVVINNVPPVSEETNKDTFIDSIVSEMTTSDMIYQMMFVTPEAITNVDTATRAGESTKTALEEHPVGGIIYFEKNYESDEQISQMINNSQGYSKIPLFIGTFEDFGDNTELGFNINLDEQIIPDYKDSYLNSDDGYSESDKSLDELKSAGINKDADLIMISHMNLPNATIENVPSSVSKEIITDLLKNELGYNGIVITDSFKKAAITDEYSADEAAIKAINAGVDIILMPEDLQKAHDALVDAVDSGEISKEKIEESVKKILTLKKEKGMIG